MNSAPPDTSANRPGYLGYVDGLRALAAAMVILPHSVGVFGPTGDSGLGRIAHALAPLAAHGVDIFFVISGFVIALSLAGRRMTFKGIGLFFVSRSVRLDPLYWLSLAVSTMLVVGQARAHGQAMDLGALAPRLLAHAVYLQDLLGLEALNVVYWTLCLEIQFYVAYSLLLLVQDKFGARAGTASLGLCLAGSAVAAGLGFEHPRQFVPYFFQFLSGVFVARIARGQASPRALAAIAAVNAALLFTNVEPARPIVTAATTIVLWLGCTGFERIGPAGRTIGRLLELPAARHLGRISYPIYLFHVPVFFCLLALRTRSGPTAFVASPWASPLWWAAGLLATLCVAEILHRIVELPCMRLSRRIKSAIRQRPSSSNITPPSA